MSRKVGDIVALNSERYPGLWKIVKINPAKTILEPSDVDGNRLPGRGVNAPHSFLLDVQDVYLVDRT